MKRELEKKEMRHRGKRPSGFHKLRHEIDPKGTTERQTDCAPADTRVLRVGERNANETS